MGRSPWRLASHRPFGSSISGVRPHAAANAKSQSVIGLFAPRPLPDQPASAAGGKNTTPPALPAATFLRLSWTHFLEFIRIADPWKRLFYENESLKGGWSVSELQRQIGSLLYERTGLSTEKSAVLAHAHAQAAESPAQIVNLIRDPYILEFTGLAEKPRYLERDLETALLANKPAWTMPPEAWTNRCSSPAT